TNDGGPGTKTVGGLAGSGQRSVVTTRFAGTRRSSLVVRNRIYAGVFDREWVLQHMPDAELRRQQEAYRRGLARATAVWGSVLTLTGALAATAAKQARRAGRATVRANQEADTARRLLYAAD